MIFSMIKAETKRRGEADKIESLLSEKIIDAAIEVHRSFGGLGYWSLYG